ncbi:unnamed protein product [Parnassius apollo]|uniref:UDP-glucuronosyltransferase n=1 Tax=Parnassius apollo TaxID=110799 RepID=A0A8S3XKS4_PARAO|nr:unnamed protein product [Parnassius apollo]
MHLVWFSIIFTNVETARILAVFPTPSISHQIVFRPLTQELVKRGHEVVVFTTDPAFLKGHAPENLTEIDVHDLSYSSWTKFVNMVDMSGNNRFDKLKIGFDVLLKVFKEQMKTKESQEIIFAKNAHFDLLLVEACARATLGLSHLFKVPVIQVSSLGDIVNNYEIVGAQSHPFLYPTLLRDRLYNLTMWEKVTQLYIAIKFYHLIHSQETSENTVIRDIFGPHTPPLNELYNNVEMLFLNIHPIWDNNRPVPPNVIFMGGLHVNPEKALPKDLKFYLDSSKNGVIYLSFGTNIQPSLLPTEKIKLFLNVFSRLPYDVLWKWDLNELPGRSNNIKISKWLPQYDLLRHPKLKLFITQGGLQSTDEAIKAGVPLIGIPMLGDQWYNVEKYIYHKIGLRLDMHTLDEKQLEVAITTILNDESYRRNVEHLRKIMADQPQRPLDRAVWWTEYVLRYGGARHLRAPTANIKWIHYLELELMCFLVTILLIMLTVFYILIKIVIMKLLTKKICIKVKES